MTVSHSLLTGVVDEPAFAALFERANAVKWALEPEAFAEALACSVASRFGASGANVGEIEGYLELLHLQDLALACACAEGHVTAWAYFLECFRPAVGNAARAIAGDEAGSEIAEALYGELYGPDQRDGHRRSLLRRYTGRSRLATWLRATIAERYLESRWAPKAATKTGPTSVGAEAGPTAAGGACPGVEVLAAWFDQSLASFETSLEEQARGEAGAIERHLVVCPRCRAMQGALVRSQPQLLYVHPRSQRRSWWQRLGEMLRLTRD